MFIKINLTNQQYYAYIRSSENKTMKDNYLIAKGTVKNHLENQKYVLSEIVLRFWK